MQKNLRVSNKSSTFAVSKRKKVNIMTTDYSKKQIVANEIVRLAVISRINRSNYDYATDKLAAFLEKVMKLDVFAAQVATTVYNNCGHGYNVANVSSKQAWIIACAAIEAGMETSAIVDYKKADEDVEMSKEATFAAAEEPAKGVSDKEAREFVMNATIEVEGNGIVVINGLRCKAADMMLVNKARTSKVSKSAMFRAYTQLMNMLNNKIA